MRALLDTHALLWWLTDDRRLSARARRVIADEGNDILVSAASAWEIATKYRLGRLSGVADVVQRFAELIAADGFTHLPVSYLHALRAGSYAAVHRDPFDRMLVAQGELESAPLVTCDAAIAGFGCATVW